MSISCFYLQLCVLSAWSPLARAGDFLGQRAALVDFEELEQDLREAADAAGGAAKIEKSLWRTFAALPKNEFGRVSPQAVRYAVQGYFSKEYGWVIEGLGSPGSQFNATDKHEASIMKERVPAYVEAMLELKQSGHGLAFNDIVIMIIVLERLILDDNVESMNQAYEMSGLSPASPADMGTLIWVHKAWTAWNSVGFRGSGKGKLDLSGEDTMILEQKVRNLKMKELDTRYDAVLNYEYANRHTTNPFISHPYSLSASLDIAQDWAREDTHRCNELKAHLVELDPRGSGRVPLQVFYAQEERSHGFYFGETAEYLRQIGALDESSGNPHLRIANYVASPANCNRHTTHYSACCTSGCAEVMHEIEGLVLSPEASPELIVSIAGNISTPSVEAPRQIPYTLVQKLYSIASLHGGVVPLHGRLFSQWVHFAFPSECPHPDSHSSSSMRNQWLDFESSHEAVVIDKTERVRQANKSYVEAFAPEPSLRQWNDHEILPFAETHRRSAWHQLSQITVIVGVLVAVARAGAAAQYTLTDHGGSGSKEKWAHFV